MTQVEAGRQNNMDCLDNIPGIKDDEVHCYRKIINDAHVMRPNKLSNCHCLGWAIWQIDHTSWLFFQGTIHEPRVLWVLLFTALLSTFCVCLRSRDQLIMSWHSVMAFQYYSAMLLFCSKIKEETLNGKLSYCQPSAIISLFLCVCLSGRTSEKSMDSQTDLSWGHLIYKFMRETHNLLFWNVTRGHIYLCLTN